MNFRLLLRGRTLLSSLTLISILSVGCGGGNGTALTTASTSTGPAANNSVAITASSGPNGSPQNGGVINGLYTTVTVCKPGTSTCAAIPNVIVDTGSIGLRLVPTAVASLGLTPVLSGVSTVEECIQYGDTSISWGPMELADVHLGGEVASNIPVQVIGSVTAGIPANCISTPIDSSLLGFNGGNLDTMQELDANGILGIGNGGAIGPYDCGSYCATTNPLFYYTCSGNSCGQTSLVPVQDQAINPVGAFSSTDHNGVVISLPSVLPGGTTTVSGTLTFGINTQADNTMGSVTIFGTDQCGLLPSVTYNNIAYTDTACTSSTGTGLGGFFDTGTGTLSISDATTLGAPISDCQSGTAGFGFYCVTGGSTTISNIGLTGNGVGSGPVSLNIADGTNLVNSNNSVFSNIGTDSATTGVANDYFDFGLPFFLGRTAYLSIGGATVPNILSPTYGLVAF